MKITMQSDIFAKKIAAAARALPSKAMLPWQGALRLSLNDGTLKIQGIDPDSMLIATQVEIDSEDEDFDCLIPGSLLADLCKDLPKGEVILHIEESQVQLETKTGSYKLPVIAGDYPSLGDELEDYIYVNFDKLTSMVSSVAVAAARNDANFSNIKIDLQDNKLTLAATDRYRLGFGAIAVEDGEHEKTALVNARLLDSALKTISKEENIGIGVDSSYFYIKNSDTLIKTRLSGGNFPNFASLLEKKEVGSLQVSSKLLQESVKRVAKFSPNMIIIELDSKTVSFQTPGDEIGSALEKIEGKWDGKALTFYVNPSYLLDAVSAVSTDTVTIKPTGSSSMMRVEGSKDVTHLVMPLRD